MREREGRCESVIDGKEVESHARLHPQQTSTPPERRLNGRRIAAISGVKVRDTEFTGIGNLVTSIFTSGRSLEKRPTNQMSHTCHMTNSQCP